MPSVYLDELKPGMTASSTHTVTERDVQLFGEATGDMNPVHFDEEFARRTVFRGRVAHGALSIGYISALLGTQLLAMLPVALENTTPLITVSGTAQITEMKTRIIKPGMRAFTSLYVTPGT